VFISKLNYCKNAWKLNKKSRFYILSELKSNAKYISDYSRDAYTRRSNYYLY
jgi:hypothetical protein